MKNVKLIENVIGKDKYIVINKDSSNVKATQIEMNESDDKIKEIKIPYIILKPKQIKEKKIK